MIESYVAYPEGKGNKLATLNKKLPYLRAAFNKAVKRGFLAQNPMSQWEWTREDEPAVSVGLPTVQRLAGHANIQTTLKYHHHVSDKALREGAVKRRQVAG